MKFFSENFGRLRRIYRIFKEINNRLESLQQDVDALKINSGKTLHLLSAIAPPFSNIVDYEFQVFSQWGEDGIIQYLIEQVEIKNKTFIEFGVQDFGESNCRFLLMSNNWSGFVIDGSDDNIDALKNKYFFPRYDLSASASFITAENVNEVLLASGFEEDLGILSIDIDGNDYYVLEAITAYKPRILICEFNAVFGLRPITVPYDSKFIRTSKHYSNLYFGASLSAIVYLAKQKGYSLVAVGSSSVNAFFVRDDLLKDTLKVLDCATTYQSSKFRESRDLSGNLTHISGEARLDLIKGLPVVNVLTKELELI